jgi:hypothetical protein
MLSSTAARTLLKKVQIKAFNGQRLRWVSSMPTPPWPKKDDRREIHSTAYRMAESQTTAQQPAVARVWRVDDKAADLLSDVRWKLSENHLEGAKKILETHKIETVSQLKDKLVGDDSQRDQTCLDALSSLFSSSQCVNLTAHLCNSIQESESPEEILARKRFLNENGSILDKAVSQEKEFTADAIAVRNL